MASHAPIAAGRVPPLTPDPQPGIVGILTQLLTNPMRGFREALSLPRWTLAIPFALAIGASFAVNAFYYKHVDLAWLGEQLTSGMSTTQRQAALGIMSVNRLLVVSIVGVTMFTLTMALVRSTVFWLVLKIRGDSRPYSELLAVTAWAATPVLLLFPAGLFNILMTNGGHLAPNDVNPVSINQLVTHLPSWAGFGRLLSTISAVSLWELALLAVGLVVAARLRWRAALPLALAPDIVLYALWALAARG